MDKTIYYNYLYDIYGELLTKKEREYFEEYYCNNLSLSEIAENNKVSRNAIHKRIKESLKKLEFYEDKLHLYKIKNKITLITKKNDILEIKKDLKSIMEE